MEAYISDRIMKKDILWYFVSMRRTYSKTNLVRLEINGINHFLSDNVYLIDDFIYLHESVIFQLWA